MCKAFGPANCSTSCMPSQVPVEISQGSASITSTSCTRSRMSSCAHNVHKGRTVGGRLQEVGKGPERASFAEIGRQIRATPIRTLPNCPKQKSMRIPGKVLEPQKDNDFQQNNSKLGGDGNKHNKGFSRYMYMYLYMYTCKLKLMSYMICISL